MRKDTIAALALAGVLVLVVDGSPENRAEVEALKHHADEQRVCERQIGRGLSRLVRDEWPELAAPMRALDYGPDPFFAETRQQLLELAGVGFLIHRACAVAHRAPRLPAHDKCSRTRKRVGC